MSDKIPERKLNLKACVDAWTKAASTTEVKTEGLAPIVSAYHRNLKRVHALTLFPPVIVQVTALVARVTNHFHDKYKGHVTAGKMTDVDLKALILAEIQRQDAARSKRLAEAGDKDPIIQSEQQMAFATLDSVFTNRAIASAADAWMSAQITGIWTAFESMAEELWRAALNVHPIGLAELKGGLKGEQNEKKKIELSDLQRHRYDLSKNMGDVLCERYAFDRLEGIRKAYREAFFCDQEVIIDLVDGKALNAISATRHVIIHNGGIIDEEFLKSTAYLPMSLYGEVGEAFQLDGNVVQVLIEPTIRTGWELIEAVDKWLDTH